MSQPIVDPNLANLESQYQAYQAKREVSKIKGEFLLATKELTESNIDLLNKQHAAKLLERGLMEAKEQYTRIKADRFPDIDIDSDIDSGIDSDVDAHDGKYVKNDADINVIDDRLDAARLKLTADQRKIDENEQKGLLIITEMNTLIAKYKNEAAAAAAGPSGGAGAAGAGAGGAGPRLKRSRAAAHGDSREWRS
jgi:hypothetical protein